MDGLIVDELKGVGMLGGRMSKRKSQCLGEMEDYCRVL
jgi:hypothetical protein